MSITGVFGPDRKGIAGCFGSRLETYLNVSSGSDETEEKNGLDYIAKVSASSKRYLVTGHFDKPEVRQGCERAGVYLLPKSEISNLPIVVV